jgi:hypothetical protein
MSKKGVFMDNMDNTGDAAGKKGFASFASKRIIVVILLTVIGLWGFIQLLGLFEKPSENVHGVETVLPTVDGHTGNESIPGLPEKEAPTAETALATHDLAADKPSHGSFEVKSPEKAAVTQNGNTVKAEAPNPKGVAFMTACIKPLNHELRERFWGWRPNDIIRFTDNVNNFQLGVLEVTRRTSVVLAERLSRTGVTASFDPNLEQAMNWFMIKATRYLLPSAESKYKEGISELTEYKERLKKGNASFYTRSDNLIPLLSAYEDLLGSCEENLVKAVDEKGDPISFFSADDYFYYAKGVASTLNTILEAVEEDFAQTVEARRGTDVLHHVVEACKRATELEPIVITNSDLDGILANHRANMAAPISHARFYLGVLIKTLST